MTGGGAKNIGICRAFEEELMREIYVADYPQFNGAIGAALIASERGGSRHGKYEKNTYGNSSAHSLR